MSSSHYKIISMSLLQLHPQHIHLHTERLNAFHQLEGLWLGLGVDKTCSSSLHHFSTTSIVSTEI